VARCTNAATARHRPPPDVLDRVAHEGQWGRPGATSRPILTLSSPFDEGASRLRYRRHGEEELLDGLEQVGVGGGVAAARSTETLSGTVPGIELA
jgi:hypothetical protein